MKVVEEEHTLEKAKALGADAKQLYENALVVIDASTLVAIEMLYRAHCLGYTLATNRLFFPKTANLDIQIDEDYFANKSAAELFFRGLQVLGGINYCRSDRCAFLHFEASAKKGCAPAQAHLGRLYEFGLGVNRDLNQAHFWYQKSSEQNCAEGHYYLALLFKNYSAFHQPDRIILALYHRATDLGFAAAMSNIGWMYANGRGVVKNKLTAFKWYQCAAEQGYARAQAHLAYYYEKGGWRIRKDLSLAMQWYGSAAAHQFPNAQYNMAWLVEQGKAGVPQDDAAAFTLYEQAAANGSVDAVFRLGCCYEEGLMGKAVDNNKAIRYFRKAFDLQHKLAKARIIELYPQVIVVNPQGVREDFQKRDITEAQNYLKRYRQEGFVVEYHYAMICDDSITFQICDVSPTEFFRLLMSDQLVDMHKLRIMLKYLFERHLQKFQGVRKIDLAIATYGCLTNPISMATVDALISILTDPISMATVDALISILTDNTYEDELQRHMHYQEIQLILAHLHYLKDDDCRVFFHFKKLIERNPNNSIFGNADFLLNECDAETLISPQKLALWLENQIRTSKTLTQQQIYELAALLAKLLFRQLPENANQEEIQHVCEILLLIPPNEFLNALRNALSHKDLVSLMRRLNDENKLRYVELIAFVLASEADKIDLTEPDTFCRDLREMRRSLNEFSIPELTTRVLQSVVNRVAAADNLCTEIIWYTFKFSRVNHLDYQPAAMTEISVVNYFQEKLQKIIAESNLQNTQYLLDNIQTATKLALLMDDLHALINNLESGTYRPATATAKVQRSEMLSQLHNLFSEMQWLKSSEFPIQGQQDCVIF